MKKFIFPITLLLIAAMAISACSAATSVAPVPTTGGAAPSATGSTAGTGTPAASQTGAATASTTGTTQAGAATSGATSAATNAATSAVTAASTGAATTAATSPAVTSTTSANQATTGTPVAAATSGPVANATGTPFAGVSGQFVRLSILLQSNLVSGSQSGQITGVVIAQPKPTSGSTTATPQANQPVPYIKYIVVDMSGSATPTPGTNEVVLPWQMFAFNQATTSANGKVNQTFTLKGSAASRANVPQVSLPDTTGVLSQGWDANLSQYWASQGFSVPVTGSSSQPDTEVVLRQTINGTNIVDPKNQALGQISDFLIDQTTGQFAYAVFNGGQLFGNRYFVVPIRNLIFQLSSASSSGLGNIQLTVPSTVLNAAPFISNLGQVPLDQNLLQQLNNYWQGVQK